MNIVSALINGLSLGSIYALIALGYTMVYGIAKMLNFAHGDIIMVGAYSVFVFLGWWNMPIAAFFFAVAVCALLGFAVEKIAYKPLRGASPLAVLLTAIGVSYFLQGVAQVAFGAGTKNVNVAIAINGKASFALGGLTITYSTIFTLIVGVALMVGLTLFIKKTRTGQAMLALSEDRGAAQLMGINANRLISLTFIIGFCARRRGRYVLSHANPRSHAYDGRASRHHGVYRGRYRRHRFYPRRYAGRYPAGIGGKIVPCHAVESLYDRDRIRDTHSHSSGEADGAAGRKTQREGVI